MKLPAAFGERIQTLTRWIDGRSLRERVILFTTGLALVFVISTLAVFAPLHKQRAQLGAELHNKQSELAALQTQTAELAVQLTQDPDAPNQARLRELTEQLREVDAPLAEMMKGLVSPQEMTQLVRTLLSQNRQLKVVNMENLPPRAIQGEAAEGETPPEPVVPLYKHGLRIEVNGGYRDIVAFLMNLEALPWQVLWDEVNVRTEEYPISSAKVVVYTLSMDQAWIGL